MSKTILLIDDSPSIRTLMRDALQRKGFDVLEAIDGQAALAQLDGRPIGVVVCDLWMPHLDGLGFLAQLRAHARYKFTPLAILSTESRPEVKAAAKKAGAQAFLNKPCTPSDLVDVVQRLCA